MFSYSGLNLARHLRPAHVVWAGSLAAVLAMSSPAFADPGNLVQNGNFSSNSASYNYNGVTMGSNANNANLANWQLTGCTSSASTCGFQFVANLNNLASNGIYNQVDNQNNFFYGAPGAAPDGNTTAFVSDASYQTAALYQTVGGLNVGDTYTLKFFQAAMQQTGFTGSSTDNWQVGLGNGSSLSAYNVQNAASMTIPSQGGVGWAQQTLTFVANATSETLFFFASASQGAQPPFLLLDGVSLTDNAGIPASVPEPATVGLLAAGLLGIVAMRRRAGQA